MDTATDYAEQYELLTGIGGGGALVLQTQEVLEV